VLIFKILNFTKEYSRPTDRKLIPRLNIRKFEIFFPALNPQLLDHTHHSLLRPLDITEYSTTIQQIIHDIYPDDFDLVVATEDVFCVPIQMIEETFDGLAAS